MRPFLKHFAARHAAALEELSYRIYVTASLKGIAKGEAIQRDWIDLARPKHVNIDAEAVVNDLVSRMGEAQ